jgi:uncharacterized membrane protein required for colicin V production
MTTLDIIIIIVFIASVARGFYKGIIMQAGGLGGLIVGIALCRVGATWVAWKIAGMHDSAPDAPMGPSACDVALANVLTFVVGYLAVKIVAHFAKTITHALCLGTIDRSAGALYSLLEWMLVLSLLINLWLGLRPGTDIHTLSTIGNGHAVELVTALAPKILGFAMG